MDGDRSSPVLDALAKRLADEPTVPVPGPHLAHGDDERGCPGRLAAGIAYYGNPDRTEVHGAWCPPDERPLTDPGR
ncbi:hypothetical protein [Amycolatopsis sp. YIM 10]|uniref:hypothetical protein n=1 Tax=Amycolatopsis sp. YIM 10 TaxID=2653857 RepID=UPI001290516D|nr:hypothetical protein [Amycolatopsis sp. YIM 10]